MVNDPRTLKSFWNSLGPHKRRNILSSYIQHQVEQGKRGPSVKETPNGLFGMEMNQDMEDVLYGVCNLGWGTKKGLRTDYLYSVVSELPVISRHQVENHLCIGERQARRYVQAAELVSIFADSKTRSLYINKYSVDDEISMENFEQPYD